jgi:hypothetical protein
MDKAMAHQLLSVMMLQRFLCVDQNLRACVQCCSACVARAWRRGFCATKMQGGALLFLKAFCCFARVSHSPSVFQLFHPQSFFKFAGLPNILETETVLFWFTFFDEVPPSQKDQMFTFFDLISDGFD